MDMARHLDPLQRFGFCQQTGQELVRAVITEERPVFVRRNTNRESGWFGGMHLQAGAINSIRVKAFNDPPAVFFANRSQYSHADPELCQSASRYGSATTHFAVEAASERCLN